MPDPSGFLKFDRQLPPRRPVPIRLRDFDEVYPPATEALISEQASRCMDCGIPFCHGGCPLGNRIPDWNDLVRVGDWAGAADSLHATNNFPEVTGRLCPAPCEAACVVGISGQPVTIKQVEVEIANSAFAAGLAPRPPSITSGRSVAVVGSGPSGLAAAQQLARAGHAVTVYERSDAIGGLLRYGIPDFKLPKSILDQRLEQMRAEGVRFVTNCEVGEGVSVAELRERHDAVLLACGALRSRELPPTPGRDLPGVHLAMEYLMSSNRVVAGLQPAPSIDAAGKHVVIIGGGDTSADCLGVAHRQGARSVVQVDLIPEPPQVRDPSQDPWPTYPRVLRTYAAHEEGGSRQFSVMAREFVGTDRVEALGVVDVSFVDEGGRRVLAPVAGSERTMPADLVLLAVGFEGTDAVPLLSELGLATRGTVDCGPDWQTAVPGVFVAGDMHRGASLIVWAIAEGRAAAAAIHAYLGGQDPLPAPVQPASRPLSVPVSPAPRPLSTAS